MSGVQFSKGGLKFCKPNVFFGLHWVLPDFKLWRVERGILDFNVFKIITKGVL